MTTGHQPFELVVFDNDGVLVDTEVREYEACAAASSTAGVHLSRRHYVEHLLGREPEALVDWLSVQVGAEAADTALADYWAQITEAGPIRPMPHARELLGALTVPYRVATSRDRATALMIIARSGLADLVTQELLIASDGVLAAKPAPDVYLAAARSAGVAPGRCLALDDSRVGVQAAQAAGMLVVGMHGLLDANDFRALGVPSAHSLAEFADMLSRTPFALRPRMQDGKPT
jgi:HAD superfamily hydrolase (TIGR01509 family)